MLQGKKTYILSCLTALCAGYLFITGAIPVEQVVELLAISGLGASLRHAIGE